MASEVPSELRIHPPRPETVRRVSAAVVALLAVLSTVYLIGQAHTDSPTYDEPVYVSAGKIFPGFKIPRGSNSPMSNVLPPLSSGSEAILSW